VISEFSGSSWPDLQYLVYRVGIAMRVVLGVLFFLLLVGGTVYEFHSSYPPATSSVDTDAVAVPRPGVEGLPGIPGQGGSRLRPFGYFSIELPIVPITFTIGSGGFSIEVSGGIATPLGGIRFGAGVAVSATDGSPVPVESVGVTRLVICEAGTDRQVCDGYAIHTGRKVQIELNGRFQETIDDSLVTITAAPGSTVTVSDAGEQANPNARPAARIDVEDFAFTASSAYTEVNLEQIQGGTENDLAYDHVSGSFQPINGAEVADIQHYQATRNGWGERGLPQLYLPLEEDCAQKPSSAWHSSFTPADLQADITVTCIFTAEKDFGYLVIGRNPESIPVSYYVYSYIWVR
jgi:hypothetical protein